VVWYLVRRHLDYEVDQWEALPWHVQLVYLEGLEQEFYDPDAGDQPEQDDLAALGATGVQVQQV
jgi:hypothetical protein